VDDSDYQVPFRFTGKMSELTIKLERENMETRMTAYHCLRAAMFVTGFVLRSFAILQAADSVPPNANSSALSPTVAGLPKPAGATPEGMVWILIRL
jgi:hypothetical protein